mgnify:CR=1 FL=1
MRSRQSQSPAALSSRQFPGATLPASTGLAAGRAILTFDRGPTDCPCAQLGALSLGRAHDCRHAHARPRRGRVSRRPLQFSATSRLRRTGRREQAGQILRLALDLKVKTAKGGGGVSLRHLPLNFGQASAARVRWDSLHHYAGVRCCSHCDTLRCKNDALGWQPESRGRLRQRSRPPIPAPAARAISVTNRINSQNGQLQSLP